MKKLLFTPLIVCSTLCFANPDPAQVDWSDAFSNKREAGGFLALGLGLHNGQGLYQSAGFRLRAEVSGAYYFGSGFFIEYPGFANKFENMPTYGYNIANFGNWEFDAIISGAHGRLSSSNGRERDSTSYWGLRTIGTIAGLDAMFIYGIAPNHEEADDGQYAAAWLAKSWNIDNWLLYTSLGVQYRNAAILNYYYGEPASATMPEPYKAEGGVNVIYKIGAKKPLSETWLVEGFVSYTHYASSIVDSPSAQNTLRNFAGRSDQGSQVNLAIKYVF